MSFIHSGNLGLHPTNAVGRLAHQAVPGRLQSLWSRECLSLTCISRARKGHISPCIMSLHPVAAVLCGAGLASTLQSSSGLFFHFFQGSRYFTCASQEPLESLEIQTSIKIKNSPPCVYLL